MNTHLPFRYLLPTIKKSKQQGLTIFDLIAEIFLIGMFLLVVPAFLNSSTVCNSTGCNSGGTLGLRLRF